MTRRVKPEDHVLVRMVLIQTTFCVRLKINVSTRMRQKPATGQMTRFITDQPQAVKTCPEEKDETATVPKRMMS